MTSSIPDSISSDDLKRLAAQANVSPDSDSDKLPCGKTIEELCLLVNKIIEKSLDEVADPIVHKLIIMRILNDFIGWHNEMGIRQIRQCPEDELYGTAGWLRDAGKFQAIANILDTIQLGENNFITPLDDDADKDSDSNAC